MKQEGTIFKGPVPDTSHNQASLSPPLKSPRGLQKLIQTPLERILVILRCKTRRRKLFVSEVRKQNSTSVSLSVWQDSVSLLPLPYNVLMFFDLLSIFPFQRNAWFQKFQLPENSKNLPLLCFLWNYLSIFSHHGRLLSLTLTWELRCLWRSLLLWREWNLISIFVLPLSEWPIHMPISY